MKPPFIKLNVGTDSKYTTLTHRCQYGNRFAGRTDAPAKRSAEAQKKDTLSSVQLESGGDLLSRAVSSQVPSALKGLTSVFGMGTGGTPSPLPPEINIFAWPARFALAHALRPYLRTLTASQTFGLLLLRMACASLAYALRTYFRTPSASQTLRFAPSSHGLRASRLPMLVVPAMLAGSASQTLRFAPFRIACAALALRFRTLTTAHEVFRVFSSCPTFFVSGLLKSSPRPISIAKLHMLPYFHRRPITW